MQLINIVPLVKPCQQLQFR